MLADYLLALLLTPLLLVGWVGVSRALRANGAGRTGCGGKPACRAGATGCGSPPETVASNCGGIDHESR